MQFQISQGHRVRPRLRITKHYRSVHQLRSWLGSLETVTDCVLCWVFLRIFFCACLYLRSIKVWGQRPSLALQQHSEDVLPPTEFYPLGQSCCLRNTAKRVQKCNQGAILNPGIKFLHQVSRRWRIPSLLPSLHWPKAAMQAAEG